MRDVKAFFQNDRYAALAGITLIEVRPGYAKATLQVRDEHKNAVGTVHGGAYFTLADFAFAVASNSHGSLALAATAHISYFQGVTEGTLVAEAREVHVGRRLGTYGVEITDGSGELVARFTGTAYRKGTALGGAGGR